MYNPLDIFADIVLSVNGEDISIAAAKDAITVSIPSLRTGIKTMANANGKRQLTEHVNRLDEVLRSQGWTLYFSYGRFKMATLGSKANLKLLKLFNRIWPSVFTAHVL